MSKVIGRSYSPAWCSSGTPRAVVRRIIGNVIRLKTAVLIRTERASDHAAVYALNAAAFESPAEAMLVDRLRREAATYIALVAEVDGKLVGHIAFTPVEVPRVPRLRIMGLAPMAVASTHRSQGVGGTRRITRMQAPVTSGQRTPARVSASVGLRLTVPV